VGSGDPQGGSGRPARNYVPAFDAVFRWTVPGLALILALVIPEKPLSEELIEVAQGRAEAPGY
jgi:hypothetical protein